LYKDEATMFSQVVLNGLFSSSLYCQVALGLTLILGVMDIADFAQGGLYMLGAFVAFFTSKLWGVPFPATIALAILATALVGVVNNVLVYQPALHRGANSLIAALGVLLILQNLALLVFGPDFQALQLPFGQDKLQILSGTISFYKGTIILITSLLVPGIWLFLQKTKIGKAIRAVSQNKEGASIVGIGSNKVSILTFCIGAAIVGATGAMAAPIYAFDVHFGTDIIVKAFTIVILGGLGSIRGTVVGALIIGIGENMLAGYLSTEYSNLLTFAMLILILFVRPQGMFGRRAI
jgi:branched-chain amino acid transport system permease protein